MGLLTNRVSSTSVIAAQKKWPNKNRDKGDDMNRFTMSFNDKEYAKLKEIVDWYSNHVGQPVSRCKVIKALLFGRYIEAVNNDLCT